MSAREWGAVIEQRLQREGALILAALSAHDDPHAAIHAVRKAVRRMRAMLALLDTDGMGLARVDRRLQRLGDSLSAVRDAHVVVEAARQLQQQHPAVQWNPVIEALETRRTRILQHTMRGDPGYRRRRAGIEQVCLALQQAPWHRVRRHDLRAGLARSERRVDKAAARAARDADPEAIHRWRRRVRRLRMQREALHALGALSPPPAGKGDGGAAAKALHALSDRLGWQQDLRLLRNLVRAMPCHPGKAEPLAQVQAALSL
ncbi:CHAD domain-containing protein [Stenotrophomonas sp.]|uniref:CHAD domain-containing protein n=1 Tax=Stenotrophomonas sp. TaxID=69392 RepID=UPI002FCAEF03